MPDLKTTKEWAEAHGLPGGEIAPPVLEFNEAYARTAPEVASRTIILQCVVAVGFEVEAEPVVEWLKEQQLWSLVSANEMSFLQSSNRTKKQRIQAQWRSEAEWALLWTIGKIEAMGLPTRCCDSGRTVDQIMPPLGGDVSDFIGGATLRPPSELLAEDDRTYNLHCFARQDRRNEIPLPSDLNYDVLYERHYAFDWLRGADEWDHVRCDT